MEPADLRHRLPSRALVTIVGSTVLLTAAFVGIAALGSGERVADVADRIPYYVLAFAVVFILVLWKLDDRHRDGTSILIAVTGIAVGTSILLAFAAEGVAYALADPSNVLERNLIVWFTAAATICTGLGLWGLRHWREFATAERSRRTASAGASARTRKERKDSGSERRTTASTRTRTRTKPNTNASRNTSANTDMERL